MASADALNQRDRLWGRDIWFDVTADGGADVVTNAAGDLADVGERECLRQALIRRYITNPNEWPTLKNYGAGARTYVKARNTRANRDELAERIRAQTLLEPRVERVSSVRVETTEDAAGIRIHVMVVPRGKVRPDETLAVGLEVR